MSSKLYRVLGLPSRSVSDAQVKSAYRRLALQWHPDLHAGAGLSPEDESHVARKFASITHAYKVLSNTQARAIFDQQGDEAVRAMAKAEWQLDRSSEDVFEAFFGTRDPFEVLSRAERAAKSEAGERGAGGAGGDADGEDVPETLQSNVYCTLEELYRGCVKKVAIDVRVEGAVQSKSFTLQIGQGWRAGTKLTFAGQGDVVAGKNKPGDVVFVLQEKPHPRFARAGNRLVYTATISLADALCGCSVDVPTLDGRVLPVAVDQIVGFGATQVVRGEGMPLPNDPKRRGKLEVRFNIRFPSQLSTEAKKQLRLILPS